MYDARRHTPRLLRRHLGFFLLIVGIMGCKNGEMLVEEREPSLTPRQVLIQEQERMVRFVVAYLRRQEAYRSGRRLDQEAVGRLMEEALAAYEQERGIPGVMKGYRIGKEAMRFLLSGGPRPAWWDSLKLDAEQRAWMDRLWEEFRTSHTVKELDERLTVYEREVVEALGSERSAILLWSSGVLYGFAMLVFGREPWVREFWEVIRTLLGMKAPGGGMASTPELAGPSHERGCYLSRRRTRAS